MVQRSYESQSLLNVIGTTLVMALILAGAPSFAASKSAPPASKQGHVHAVKPTHPPTDNLPDDPTHLALRIYGNWTPTVDIKGRQAKVKITMTDAKNVSAVQLVQSSGSAQYDADVLEAVLSAVGALKAGKGGTSHTITFDSNTPGSRKLALRNLSPARNTEQNNAVFIHRIPVSFYRALPGQFAIKELVAQSNMIQVSNNSATKLSPKTVSTIQNISGRWSNFLAQNPKATRSAVESFSKTIDSANSKSN